MDHIVSVIVYYTVVTAMTGVILWVAFTVTGMKRLDKE